MKKCLLILFVLMRFILPAQVAVNTDGTPANNSAMLDVKSTDKGVLLPRMTLTQRDAIANPAEGLMIYCSNCGTNGSLSIYTNGKWRTFTACFLASPVAGTPVMNLDQITWVWAAVTGATGYKWSTGNIYETAVDMGSTTQKSENNIVCDTTYTRYVWAYNDCGVSDPTILTKELYTPAVPVAGTHELCFNYIEWNWNYLPDVYGFRWNSINDYESAVDIGMSLQRMETGLSCGMNYTRYVWSYNACGHSPVSVLTQSTAACSPGVPCTGLPSFVYGGKVYHTVQIGSQCWMKENLNIGIMLQATTNQSNNGTIEKYCYNNDTANCSTYGGLYQWNELMQYSTLQGSQGICPAGWHIPASADFDLLCNTLGGAGLAGGPMKEACFGHWWTPNANATNSSGFTALPASARGWDGYFYTPLGCYGTFWSSTQSDATNAWKYELYYGNDNVEGTSVTKQVGYSVRCVKD